ncbi:SDR family NAD(P)-dependent oxidoreductase [Paenibacillus wulumuqiensis]|uniref:SDR family NAD(P)-dependent oxidoreductase n=1 Tax=Paenibacillus wulumuqiensis TaxID=1567107 RepID=UPI000619F50C|nr:SDR family NAD(P)-dependent oxidoreductase [Paenibacillus wulumuqiensis]
MPRNIPHDQLNVVITGASSGTGLGLAQRLAAEGASVVIAARRTHLLKQMEQQYAPKMIAVTADVSREEGIAAVYEAAMSRLGRIDVWVNNAGAIAIGPFTESPLSSLVQMTRINLLGNMYGSHYALRQFKQQGYGTLINVSSFAGKVAFPYLAAYSGSKAAVSGLSYALNQEMQLEGHQDIHVCAVHPWVMNTPWTGHAANYSGHEINMKPLDDPDDIIDAMYRLIDHPQESVEVGFKVKGTALSSNLLPRMTEKISGQFVQNMIYEAPPAEFTAGSLYDPVFEGTGVHGDGHGHPRPDDGK